jgi:hypothetical protein
VLVNDATHELSLASAIENRQIMYLEMISEAAVAAWARSRFWLATALRNKHRQTGFNNENATVDSEEGFLIAPLTKY